MFCSRSPTSQWSGFWQLLSSHVCRTTAPFRNAAAPWQMTNPSTWAETTREVPAGRLPARSFPCPESLMAPSHQWHGVGPGPRYTVARYEAKVYRGPGPTAGPTEPRASAARSRGRLVVFQLGLLGLERLPALP